LLRNACKQASDILSVEVLYPGETSTTYAGPVPPAGPAPPGTSAEMLAFALINIINNVVESKAREEYKQRRFQVMYRSFNLRYTNNLVLEYLAV
jgi:hypothetical protein